VCRVFESELLRTSQPAIEFKPNRQFVAAKAAVVWKCNSYRMIGAKQGFYPQTKKNRSKSACTFNKRKRFINKQFGRFFPFNWSNLCTRIQSYESARVTPCAGIMIGQLNEDTGNSDRFVGDESVENHTCAAAPREKETADFLLVREVYEKATGNRWSQSDSEAYDQNSIANVPPAKIISIVETVVRRTPTKINSFKYFVKEITAQPDPRNRAWQKKRLEKIVHKMRDISVGRGGYSITDFVDEVKCSCAREGIAFDNDTFNELVG
jgi:hypothetical protein